jgi:hypothetical protein
MLRRAVLVLGANKGLAFMAERRGLDGFVGGVRVRVQIQYPRLRQQRPRQAEQQKEGDIRTQGVHECKDAWKEIKAADRIILSPQVL